MLCPPMQYTMLVSNRLSDYACERGPAVLMPQQSAVYLSEIQLAPHPLSPSDADVLCGCNVVPALAAVSDYILRTWQ